VEGVATDELEIPLLSNMAFLATTCRRRHRNAPYSTHHQNGQRLAGNGGDKRPILLNCVIDESLDGARVTGALYYLSAGFLTVNGCDSSSHQTQIGVGWVPGSHWSDSFEFRKPLGVGIHRGGWSPASEGWNFSCKANGCVGEEIARSALQRTIFYTPSKWAPRPLMAD
jgi:hypothetical protein